MTPVVDTDIGQEARYETPTFDPRGAFAWTLRSGEAARLQRRRRQSGLLTRSAPTRTEADTSRRLNGYRQNGSPARCYETPTFDPRGAFAWTLRSGEVARLERLHRLPEPRHLDVLAGVS